MNGGFVSTPATYVLWRGIVFLAEERARGRIEVGRIDAVVMKLEPRQLAGLLLFVAAAHFFVGMLFAEALCL